MLRELVKFFVEGVRNREGLFSFPANSGSRVESRPTTHFVEILAAKTLLVASVFTVSVYESVKVMENFGNCCGLIIVSS